MFLLSLILFPCDDVRTSENCEAAVHYHFNDNHEHDADADLCSPFCQCNCCQTHITNNKLTEMSPSELHLPQLTSGYFGHNGKDYSGCLFQPPQQA